MVQSIDKVKIGAIDYAVTFVDDLKDERGKLDGCIKYHQAEINIEADMNDQAKVQSLLHEIVHALDMQYGLGLRETAKDSPVDRLAFGIYQVMRDNPELIAVIYGYDIEAIENVCAWRPTLATDDRNEDKKG